MGYSHREIAVTKDAYRSKRPVFSATGWGAPGLAGVVVGIAALAKGAVGAGVIATVVGTLMVLHGFRVYRRTGRL